MVCQKLKTYMETGRVVFLPARSIRPNPSQPRKFFPEDALEELTASIRLHGILQPLSVRRVGAFYELIAGERRLRAAIAAGLSEIPCIVMNMTDRESGMTALVENLQRQDLSYLEQAQGISFLMDSFSLSQEQAAQMLGMSQSAVANKLRLLRHSAPVQQRLRETGLTERHARALLKLPGEPDKLRAIENIARLDMNVSRTEQYIDSLLESPDTTPKKTNISAFLKHIRAPAFPLYRSARKRKMKSSSPSPSQNKCRVVGLSEIYKAPIVIPSQRARWRGNLFVNLDF